MRMSVRRGRRLSLVLAAALAAVVPGLAAPAQASPAPAAKTAVIVQLDAGVAAAVEARLAAANGAGHVRHVYRAVLNGFAGEFSAAAIAALRRNPHVRSVEADGVARIDTTQSPAPSWGLDRIDQHHRPLNGAYTYAATAAGVRAYIIDTGVSSNGDLDRRESGYDVFTGLPDGSGDCNGHGTHVAGTVAGNRYGVAKDAVVVPVRVLDCTGSGSWSGVIAALDWVVADHDPGELAVANMSLGGARNSAVDAAVQRAITDGVLVSVAAGNNGANACNYSPARVGAALTVGATDRTDRRASFSNFGSCLDLFAPGVDITSDWLLGGTNTISGTSMATPHVTGAAALVLARNPSLSPAQLASRVVATATTGVVTKPGSRSPNRLLFSPPN
jgi:subtilisin family serine protease